MQSTKNHNSKNQVIEGEKFKDIYGMIPRVRSNALVQVLSIGEL